MTEPRPASPPTAPTSAAPSTSGQQGWSPSAPAQSVPSYAGGQPGGWPQQPGQPTQQKLRPVGPILMILGSLICVLGVFLPWNYEMVAVDGPNGGLTFQEGPAWSGFEQMSVNMDNGRFYGTLMLVAFIVALAAIICVLIAAFGTLLVRPTTKGLGVLGLIGAILGILATLGMLVGYLALGAGSEMHIGTWVYGLSFIPVLIGSIGVLSKKY